MGAIPDLGALKPIIDSLLAKGLMIELTAPGRGQVVSHNLYKERELTELKTRFAGHVPTAAGDDDASLGSRGAGAAPGIGRPVASGSPAPQITRDMFSELQLEVAQLRSEVARLREQVRHIATATGISQEDVQLGTDL
jgi:hypothetical protein